MSGKSIKRHRLRDMPRYRDMPIRRKLLAITMLVAFLISIVSIGGFQMVAQNSNKMIYTQTAGSLGVVSDKIASRLNNLMDVSLYLAVNRELQINLDNINTFPQTSAHGVARSEISSMLYRTFHSDLISITVIPRDSNPIAIGSSSSQENEFVLARARYLAEEAMGAPVWLSTGRIDGSVLCAREIRNTTRPFLKSMGLLLLRVNLSKIARESANDILSGEYQLSISQNGERLYPYVKNGENIFDDSVFNGDLPYTISRLGDEIRFVTRSDIQAFRLNWSLVLSIPYEDIFNSIIFANSLFMLSLGLAVLLSMLLSKKMLNTINRNVQLLSSKMDRVRRGDLEPYPNPVELGNDELGLLNRHFDKMTADFKQVIEDNYIKELTLTQTQLKALEQQINPHFLYNSLESINWFARRGDGKNVSLIAQSLGRLLRSTLSENEDQIPLSRELEILSSYLQIQRIRFPDTLRVSININEAAMNMLIPKMSIQPLVENAIVHSLEENIGECHIDVRISMSDGFMKVEVENDGSEIDVDILEKLYSKVAVPKGNGIGLINIDSRIKLLYGKSYGIKLKNANDRVIVEFSIPAIKYL